MHDSNLNSMIWDDMNRNSQLAVLIALLSTIIGLMVHIFTSNKLRILYWDECNPILRNARSKLLTILAIFYLLSENIGESQMRKQNIVVRRPTRNLSILNHTIAKNFGEGYYHCRVFVCSVNQLQDEYVLQFFHTNPSDSAVKQGIRQCFVPILWWQHRTLLHTR